MGLIFKCAGCSLFIYCCGYMYALTAFLLVCVDIMVVPSAYEVSSGAGA